MPRNGAGVYSLPAGNPVVTGTVIASSWANTTLSDIATALTGSLPVNGAAPMTGQLLVAAGALSTPSIGLSGDVDTGVWLDATVPKGVSSVIDGTEVLRATEDEGVRAARPVMHRYLLSGSSPVLDLTTASIVFVAPGNVNRTVTLPNLLLVTGNNFGDGYTPMIVVKNVGTDADTVTVQPPTGMVLNGVTDGTVVLNDGESAIFVGYVDDTGTASVWHSVVQP